MNILLNQNSYTFPVVLILIWSLICFDATSLREERDSLENEFKLLDKNYTTVDNGTVTKHTTSPNITTSHKNNKKNEVQENPSKANQAQKYSTIRDGKAFNAIVVIGNKTHRISGPIIQMLLSDIQNKEQNVPQLPKLANKDRVHFKSKNTQANLNPLQQQQQQQLLVNQQQKQREQLLLTNQQQEQQLLINKQQQPQQQQILQEKTPQQQQRNPKWSQAANEVAEINNILGKPLTDEKALGFIKKLLLHQVHHDLAKTMEQESTQDNSKAEIERIRPTRPSIIPTNPGTLYQRFAIVESPDGPARFKESILGPLIGSSTYCRNLRSKQRCKHLRDVGICLSSSNHQQGGQHQRSKLASKRCQQTCSMCDPYLPCKDCEGLCIGCTIEIDQPAPIPQQTPPPPQLPPQIPPTPAFYNQQTVVQPIQPTLPQITGPKISCDEACNSGQLACKILCSEKTKPSPCLTPPCVTTTQVRPQCKPCHHRVGDEEICKPCDPFQPADDSDDPCRPCGHHHRIHSTTQNPCKPCDDADDTCKPCDEEVEEEDEELCKPPCVRPMQLLAQKLLQTTLRPTTRHPLFTRLRFGTGATVFPARHPFTPTRITALPTLRLSPFPPERPTLSPYRATTSSAILNRDIDETAIVPVTVPPTQKPNNPLLGDIDANGIPANPILEGQHSDSDSPFTIKLQQQINRFEETGLHPTIVPTTSTPPLNPLNLQRITTQCPTVIRLNPCSNDQTSPTMNPNCNPLNPILPTHNTAISGQTISPRVKLLLQNAGIETKLLNPNQGTNSLLDYIEKCRQQLSSNNLGRPNPVHPVNPLLDPDNPCQLVDRLPGFNLTPLQIMELRERATDSPEEAIIGGHCFLTIDIGIAVDTSRAAYEHWPQIQQFLISLIRQFQIVGKSRVGLITFSDQARIEIPFSGILGRTGLFRTDTTYIERIKKIRANPFGFQRRTDYALDSAIELFKNGRRGVTKVLFLLEHGGIVGNDPSVDWRALEQDPADKLRNLGVNMFVVGITPRASAIPEELEDIAGSESHVLKLQGYEQLQSVVPQLVEKACRIAAVVKRSKNPSEPHSQQKKVKKDCRVKFTKLGCYNDDQNNPRPLPLEILNDVNHDNPGFSFKDFVCRCAEETLRRGFKVFGIQNYASCWSGPSARSTYFQDGKADDNKCVADGYKKCDIKDALCVGKKESNFVYTINDAYKRNFIPGKNSTTTARRAKVKKNESKRKNG